MNENKRRLFLKGAVFTTATAAFSADAAWATKIGMPHREVEEQAGEKLDTIAETLLNSIQVPNSIEINGSNHKLAATFNKEVLAGVLTRLAYLDSGPENLEKILQFVSERGLVINYDKPLLAYATMAQSQQESEPNVMVLDPAIVEDYYNDLPQPYADRMIRHELYHMIQYARDPATYSSVRSAEKVVYSMASMAGALTFGIATARFGNKVITDRLKVDNASLSRRQLFQKAAVVFSAGMVNAVAGSEIARQTAQILGPTELQAHIQTGTFKLPPIIQDRNFLDFQGKLFTFEHMNA